MNQYKYSTDYDDHLLAELYDLSETYTDDVDLLRQLITRFGPLKILECFSGTGRILRPLAQDGHVITGIELAEAMQARAKLKLSKLGKEIRQRVELKTQTETIVQYRGKKHPVRAAEVEAWLLKHGFTILLLFGDRGGNPYTPESNRTIFWAQKKF